MGRQKRLALRVRDSATKTENFSHIQIEMALKRETYIASIQIKVVVSYFIVNQRKKKPLAQKLFN